MFDANNTARLPVETDPDSHGAGRAIMQMVTHQDIELRMALYLRDQYSLTGYEITVETDSAIKISPPGSDAGTWMPKSTCGWTPDGDLRCECWVAYENGIYEPERDPSKKVEQ